MNSARLARPRSFPAWFLGAYRDGRNVTAAISTWLALCVAVFVDEGPPFFFNALWVAIFAAAAVAIGFACTWRVRPYTTRAPSSRIALFTAAGMFGSLFGGLVLGQLLLIEMLDPEVARSVVSKSELATTQLVVRAFGASVLEEVVVRLLGIGALAWLLTWRMDFSPARAFKFTLLMSAAFFGLVHMPAVSSAGFVIVSVNALGGLLLGWIFWRWGLPYAITCHFAGGLIIQGFGPTVLA